MPSKIRVPEEHVSPQLSTFIESQRPADVVLTGEEMEQIRRVMPEMTPEDNTVSWYAQLDRGVDGSFCLVDYLPVMDWPSLTDQQLDQVSQILSDLGHGEKQVEVPAEIWNSLGVIERTP
jgi:hypothetical protein